MTENGTTTTTSDYVQHPWFERLARSGQVVSGVLHLLLAFIIIRLAFGKSGAADQSGALRELSTKPGGSIALWLALVGFAALALWRVVEGVFGKASEEDSGDLFDRLKAFSLAGVYFAFAWTTLSFVIGSGRSSSQENVGLSARLMESGPGKLVVVAVGIIVFSVGCYHVYKGVSKNFLEDLERHPGKFAERAGFVGYIAKGLALAGIGVLVVIAVFTADPSKASGLDGAVKELGQHSFGTVLMVLTGLGIGIYGLYSFVLARHARM